MAWVEKQTTHVKLTDSSCETLVSWLVNPVFRPEGVSPGRTVPVVPCSPLWCNFKPGTSSRKTPKTTVVYS